MPGAKNKVFWSLFKINLCSVTSFKRSRRELSIDVAEHRLSWKITKIRIVYYRRFSFTSKTGIELPETFFCMYLTVLFVPTKGMVL